MEKWNRVRAKALKPIVTIGGETLEIPKSTSRFVPLLHVVGPFWDSVHIPVEVVSEANRRDHWRVRNKRRKYQQAMVAFALAAARKYAGVVTVQLTRIGKRKLDDDNLVSAFKATRDQVAKWLGVDDGDDAVKYEYDQEAPSKLIGIRITLHRKSL